VSLKSRSSNYASKRYAGRSHYRLAVWSFALGALTQWLMTHVTSKVRNNGSTQTQIRSSQTPTSPQAKMIHPQKEVLQHQKTSAALQQSNELFELLVTSVEDYAIFMLNPDGIVISWNKGAERIKGYKAEEIIGTSFTRFYTPEDVKIGVPLKALAAAIQEGHFEGEGFRVRKDGSTFFANVVITAVYNAAGELVGFAKVTRDATQRRAAEQALQNAKIELEQRVQERMNIIKELEAFSYSVSHDLRAPLRQVQGLSQAILEDYGDKLDEDGTNYITHLQTACSGMETLISELLKLSQLTMGSLDQQEINLSGLAREIAFELKALHPDRDLDFRIHNTAPVVGDRALLRVVLYNLFENSAKFTAPESKIIIEFGQREGSFYVQDNGVGFDMQYVSRLFGPFQRLHTQSEFPGTGVGLATVQRIIRQHNGRIWVESELERGTTFYFTLETTS
jgi:PAS domain S-box-containing protein